MPVVLNILGSRPKRDIIEMAYSDCAVAGYEFGLTPDEISDGLRKLNVMMDSEPWSRLQYNRSDYGDGLPEDLSDLSAWAIGAVSSHLALRIAPAMGKTLSREQMSERTRLLELVHAKTLSRPSVAFSHDAIAGQGNRRVTLFADSA